MTPYSRTRHQRRSRPDHAQYLDSWLRVLKADKKAISTAASKASQVVDLLNSISGV